MSKRVILCSCLVAVAGLFTLSGAQCIGGEQPEFTSADAARGGALYDKWWSVTGATAPTTDHSLWAGRPDQTSNTRTGEDTWRCKECHGWDYKGVDGAYGTGSHRTGIAGIFGTTKTAQEIFDLLKGSSSSTSQATPDHGFGSVLDDSDIWDLTKFVLTEGQFDTSDIIDSSGMFTGNAANGSALYNSGIAGGLACFICHGADGKTLNFDTNEFVGTLANDNPEEFQHKVRFGHPGTAMPSSVTDGGTTQDVNDVGAHAQTLPTS